MHQQNSLIAHFPLIEHKAILLSRFCELSLALTNSTNTNTVLLISSIIDLEFSLFSWQLCLFLIVFMPLKELSLHLLQSRPKILVFNSDLSLVILTILLFTIPIIWLFHSLLCFTSKSLWNFFTFHFFSLCYNWPSFLYDLFGESALCGVMWFYVTLKMGVLCTICMCFLLFSFISASPLFPITSLGGVSVLISAV